jgi:hypothetical protein
MLIITSILIKNVSYLEIINVNYRINKSINNNSKEFYCNYVFMMIIKIKKL